MLNSNSFKTSLIFLGIIFIAILVRMFTSEHELLVKTPNQTQTASTYCSQGEGRC